MDSVGELVRPLRDLGEPGEARDPRRPVRLAVKPGGQSREIHRRRCDHVLKPGLRQADVPAAAKAEAADPLRDRSLNPRPAFLGWLIRSFFQL